MDVYSDRIENLACDILRGLKKVKSDNFVTLSFSKRSRGNLLLNHDFEAQIRIRRIFNHWLSILSC
jgi:hypothetical protein